jgi:arylsulfatase A-like enzyme
MSLVSQLLAACLLLTGFFAFSASAADSQRPNVLFLFTDDQRTDTIAALGNPHIKTPNLDSLVRSGFVFRNAYCMGSDRGAVCFPSRNMLMSGRAYFRLDGGFALPEDPNFPDSMKRAGYYTYHHGKLGNTARKIHPVFNSSRYLKDQQDRKSGEPGKEIVDAAIEFLDKRDGEQPFFMYLAFASPHDPRVAAKKYMDQYDREKIPLPKNYMPIHPFDNGWMTGRDEQLAPWPRTEEVVREHLHDYYAVITGLDHHIGRLLEDLKRRGEYDHTLIIFSSDHGLAIGSHGLFGKQSLYEHSGKAPLIFSGPGIPRGRSDALVYLYDIYPTVLELVGAEIPDGLDAHSLAPIIAGKKDGVRHSLFTAYENVQRAIRDERWKLIRYPQINRTQLFDLQTDPDELNDLSAEPGQAERIDRLFALMRQSQRRLGDDALLTVENPRDPTFVPPSASE